jgi:hypothetical protein
MDDNDMADWKISEQEIERKGDDLRLSAQRCQEYMRTI